MKRIKLAYILAIITVLLSFGTAHSNSVEQKFIKAGLIDVNRIVPSIQVDLVNSDSKKNYFRENFYQGLDKAYLRREVALKLKNAQRLLQKKRAGFSLQILDAARPRSVSRKMYNKMKGTKFEKYVANPKKGSMHNYGIAVDITIVDSLGREIDMGPTPFRKSTLGLYWMYAKMKLGFKLTERQKNNRKLLADTMKSAGFFPLSLEWWHFNGMRKAEARKRYRIIE